MMSKLFMKTGYIKVNIYTAMNFKERGITIGDLIIIIIILASTILIKVNKNDKNSTLNSNNQLVKFDKQISLSKIV